MSGIMPDTPLGQVVSIRAEKDPKKIRNFTKEQKRIRMQWQMRKLEKIKENKKSYVDYWTRMQQEFKNAYLQK